MSFGRNVCLAALSAMIEVRMRESNSVKIAIHHRPGSFSDRWIESCKEKQVAYSIVSCYDSDIIARLRDFDMLLWHWHQVDTKAILFARQLILSLQNLKKSGNFFIAKFRISLFDQSRQRGGILSQRPFITSIILDTSIMTDSFKI